MDKALVLYWQKNKANGQWFIYLFIYIYIYFVYLNSCLISVWGKKKTKTFSFIIWQGKLKPPFCSLHIYTSQWTQKHLHSNKSQRKLNIFCFHPILHVTHCAEFKNALQLQNQIIQTVCQDPPQRISKEYEKSQKFIQNCSILLCLNYVM